MAISRPVLIGVVVLAAIVIGAYLLYGGGGVPYSPYGAPAAETTPAEETPPAQETPAAGEVVEIQIEGTEWKLIPAEVEVSEGVRVKITFRNTGTYPHALVIENPDTGFRVASEVIGPGQETVFEFDAPESGTYVLYCPVGNHRQLGMEGTFTVTGGS